MSGKGSTHAWRLVQLLDRYPELDLSAFGLQHVDIHAPLPRGMVTSPAPPPEGWTLSTLVEFLRGAYAGPLGVEFTHVTDGAQERWMITETESLRATVASQARLHRLAVQQALLEAEALERTVAKHFPAAKRFSIEGGEALVPGLRALFHHLAADGVETVALGMAHRGRLNVLGNVLHKPLGALFHEFKTGRSNLQAGDVKYHLGTSVELGFGSRFEDPSAATSAHPVHGISRRRRSTAATSSDASEWAHNMVVNLAPNPSHLELVSPVVIGSVRAEQQFTGDNERCRSLAVLIHGDAAFSGQGIIAETLELSDLPEYTTGGTIHIVLNNQIGFTTDPKRARSSPHPTDVAKGVGAPILHVNADDPDTVVQAFILAARWRQTFHRDVVLDLVCYRRNGHNELDDPRPTQPLMYRRIQSMPTVTELNAERLIRDGVASPQEVHELRDRVWDRVRNSFSPSETYSLSAKEWVRTNWQGKALSTIISERPYNPTGLPLHRLALVGRAMSTVPEGFDLHPEVRKLLDARRTMVEDPSVGVDWACAEALAFGTLMLNMPKTVDTNRVEYEMHPPVDVRLSGQDVERGTFNHRHAVLYDQTDESSWTPLNHIEEGQGSIRVCNSSLSELAVLGFEYGFSVENPNALVLWEAQFGDFVNGAQAIVDSFLASGEAKWGSESNLVLLLPHGYEGQGPDHSSGMLERFLQLMNDDADNLPGLAPDELAQIDEGFKSVDKENKGVVTHDQILTAMKAVLPTSVERASHVLRELGSRRKGADTVQQDEWRSFMIGYLRRNAERLANMCVVNCTTPANYFHALRRQIHRPFNKPLVVMAPKTLLHHRHCRSNLSDFGPSTHFMRVYGDTDIGGTLDEAERVEKVLLCSGKIFYQLSAARRKKKIRTVAIVRLEQIAPFPHDHIAFELNKYPQAKVQWVQEEPKNRGAWCYVQPRLNTVLRSLCETHRRESDQIEYIGRPSSAVPATGSFVVHSSEQTDVIRSALEGV